MISYRLVFTETKGIIKGYSITDLQGENETKNIISGKYNRETNQFFFEEKEVEYTKSKIIQNDFCNVSFKGKVKLSSSTKIKGKFESFFSDKKPCISGEIILVTQTKAENKLVKMDAKIQNSNKIKEKVKDSISLLKILDDLKINILKKDELTTVYFNTDEIYISVYDVGKEDGDVISLEIDGLDLLLNYEVKNKEKIIKLKLVKAKSILQIKSVSDGKVSPNTTKIKIYNATKTIELLAHLNLGDFTSIVLIKNKS
ncbi:hypothetical protein [Flavobacterium sp.]|uniref:hypothetical protein n=2 Tax=Flavobacterium sp. TaxID=239 RepID=UPI004048E7A5